MTLPLDPDEDYGKDFLKVSRLILRVEDLNVGPGCG